MATTLILSNLHGNSHLFCGDAALSEQNGASCRRDVYECGQAAIQQQVQSDKCLKTDNNVFSVSGQVLTDPQGNQYTFLFQGDDLLIKPYSVENQDASVFCGKFVPTFEESSQLVEELINGSIDFFVTYSQNKTPFLYTGYYYIDGELVTRKFNYTEDGPLNGNESIFGCMEDFTQNTRDYSHKHTQKVAS